jgi:hypothetical protein
VCIWRIDDHILWSVFLIRVIAMKSTKVLTSDWYVCAYFYVYLLRRTPRRQCHATWSASPAMAGLGVERASRVQGGSMVFSLALKSSSGRPGMRSCARSRCVLVAGAGRESRGPLWSHFVIGTGTFFRSKSDERNAWSDLTTDSVATVSVQRSQHRCCHSLCIGFEMPWC